MGLENKTIVLLIDFEGHPAMGDEHTNHLRYSCLNGLLSIPDSDLYIISNHLQGISSDDKSTHLKMCEIEKMVARVACEARTARLAHEAGRARVAYEADRE